MGGSTFDNSGRRQSAADLLSYAKASNIRVVVYATLPAAMKAFEVGGTTLSLALFTDVTNSKELLDLMQAGTLEPEIALLNALLIPNVFPVLAAAHKTLIAKSREALTTRTLHSELVYNYSGSKHISESLKRSGISDSTSYILVARFGASADEVTAIKELIKGAEIALDELEERANQAQIQKHYKISALELGISSLSDAITCRIAARDAL
ncbi:Kinase binding protein [Forsythia ovata]|uniref:Kinase binding protein n=1 Tax=Forsythia ovata TaxID=205694 RepID=A0ABD1P1L2_9LAMI